MCCYKIRSAQWGQETSTHTRNMNKPKSKLMSSPSDSKLASWAAGGGENDGLQCSGPRGHPHRPLGPARCPMPGRVSLFRILKGDTRKASDPAVTPWMGLDARLLEGIGGQRTCIRAKASATRQGIEALPTSVWAKASATRQGRGTMIEHGRAASVGREGEAHR